MRSLSQPKSNSRKPKRTSGRRSTGNQKPTFAAADTLNVTATSTFTGIDGLLGPGPPPTSNGSSTPPATIAPAPVAIKPLPKPLHCGKGKVKKRVKSRVRCVKRHKSRHAPKRHHHQNGDRSHR